MEKQKPTHSLHNDKFKNIGIDTSFVEQNATEYNDKIAGLYNGGKKESTEGTSLSEVLNRTSKVQTVNTPVGQQVEPIKQKEESNMESQSQNSQPRTIDITQLEKMMDEKVMGLATKMQQYANETDATIKELKQQIFKLEQKVANFHSKPAENSSEEPQQTLASSGVQAPAAEKKSTIEEDVAIDKMFNFSHNKTGQR